MQFCEEFKIVSVVAKKFYNNNGTRKVQHGNTFAQNVATRESHLFQKAATQFTDKISPLIKTFTEELLSLITAEDAETVRKKHEYERCTNELRKQCEKDKNGGVIYSKIVPSRQKKYVDVLQKLTISFCSVIMTIEINIWFLSNRQGNFH